MMKKTEVMSRIVYVVEDTNAPQFRYRVKNIIEALENNKKWKIEYCLKSDLGKLKLEDVKILIIVRQTAKDGVVLRLIKKAKGLNITVLFDLDDLVFDYRDLRVLIRSVCEKNILYWLGYICGIRRIAKKVNGFICTNESLAEKLKRSFGKPVGVIRNSLDREQVELSREITKQKTTKKKTFTIGFFSGSPTHEKDFRVVEPGLMRFLSEHEDTKLIVVGYMKLSDQMNQLIDGRRVEVKKPVNYLELLKLVSEVEVNIAPLVINDFTNCKSELKYFEAAVVETTTIASPTYAFKKAIKDGENGFLAKPGEWYSKLEYLYKHPEENRKIALAAKEYALKHYYGEEFLKEVEAAYDYFAK